MGRLSGYVEDWNPAPQTVEDALDSRSADRLGDILGIARPGDGSLPALWEWAFFVDWPAKNDLQDDGHPHHGPFQPPLPNRRRMWAGGRVDYTGTLRLDVPATRTGTLLSCEEKQGRSGEMLLVSVGYDYAQDGVVVVREQQNHVYRIGDDDAARPDWGNRPSAAPESGSAWQHLFVADPVDLFRFSAITGNSHRIHYDQPYVTGVEGFPGLVVHGPLLGMQLAALAMRHAPDLTMRDFELRLARPVFAGEPVAATGDPTESDGNVTADLRIVSHPDVVHATATATFAPQDPAS